MKRKKKMEANFSLIKLPSYVVIIIISYQQVKKINRREKKLTMNRSSSFNSFMWTLKTNSKCRDDGNDLILILGVDF